MLLATAGILMIMGLLAFTAFFVWKEHLEAMRRDAEIMGRPLPRHIH